MKALTQDLCCIGMKEAMVSSRHWAKGQGEGESGKSPADNGIESGCTNVTTAQHTRVANRDAVYSL